MSNLCTHPWQQLFPGPPPGVAVKWENFFLLRKHQHPWLLLPTNPALACQALPLYPAQTAKARLARTVLRLALRCGWFPQAERITLPRTRVTPWEQFLQSLEEGGDFPPLASLAGNPAATGQRLVFLIFNDQGKPQWVVKAGVGELATTLIERETAILKSLPSGCPGGPMVRGEFSQDKIRAFAMDYCPGTSPATSSDAAPSPILSQWIDRNREIPILELPAIQQLVAVCEREPWFDSWRQIVAAAKVHPVIMHGDFAPWNIKVRAGQWTVLDWERGDLTGVPGWDWFHFVIQPELLVTRRPVTVVAARLRRLLRSPGFEAYARATRINGKEEHLLGAYLAYAARVIKPSEGLAATEQLWQEFRS